MKKMLRGIWVTIRMAIELPFIALFVMGFCLHEVIVSLISGDGFKKAMTIGAIAFVWEGHCLMVGIENELHWAKTGLYRFTDDKLTTKLYTEYEELVERMGV